MHAARIELDDAFFVRQSAKSHALVGGIILLRFANMKHRVQRILAASEHLPRLIDRLFARDLRDDYRLLWSGQLFCLRLLNCELIPILRLCEHALTQSERCGRDCSCGKKLPAGTVHARCLRVEKPTRINQLLAARYWLLARSYWGPMWSCTANTPESRECASVGLNWKTISEQPAASSLLGHLRIIEKVLLKHISVRKLVVDNGSRGLDRLLDLGGIAL